MKSVKRQELSREEVWHFDDLFANDETFLKALAESEEKATEIASYEGRLGSSPEVLLKALKEKEALSLLSSHFLAYSMMKSDVDTKDQEALSLNQRAMAVEVRNGEKLAFFDPEILSLSSEYLDRAFTECRELEKYSVYIKDVRRLKEHTLDKNAEKLLASAQSMAIGPYQAFSMLQNADLQFPSVEMNGEEIPVSNARFVPLQTGNNRALRKAVYEAFYKVYQEHRNTFAALFDAQLKQQYFFAKARNYPTAFAASVGEVDVSEKVWEHLISAVHKKISAFHDYVSLRKEMLGLEDLSMYDVYAPMVKDYEYHIDFEEAKEVILKGLKPLGEDYQELLKKAYSEYWIDAKENDGKRVGAYCNPVFGVHPFILMSYQGTMDDLFTLAHELGHAMHSYYSEQKQGFLNSQYKLFVAEVASTTNEVLLLYYLMEQAKNKEEKLYLYNHFLESFKGTFFRQTMLSEFERKAASMLEAGEAITADSLEKVYHDLNSYYFGPDMKIDDLISVEWSRIPHFYYNFYVYQYATSFAVSCAIAKRILAKEEGALEQYKKFLSSGCTNDPVSLLQLAGVDLSTEKPMVDAISMFHSIVQEMRDLYHKA